MIVDISKILNGIVDEISISEKFRVEDLKVNGKLLKFNWPISFDGKILKSEENIFVYGDLFYEYIDVCDRCLIEFKNSNTISFDGIVLEKGKTVDEEDDIFVIHYDKGKIDLKEVAVFLIMMSLPMKSTCKEDCKGICPQCGKDLNEGDCGCSDIDIDPRLAKLKELID